MNYKTLFSGNAEFVAKELLGGLLIRNTSVGSTGAKILEVGAYEGNENSTSRAGMNYSPGRIFLMHFRGYYLFNISTGRENYASCVEIRKIGLHNEVVRGAGKITNFLSIPKSLEGVLLGKEIEIISQPLPENKILKLKSNVPNCLGYFSIKN